MGKGKILVIDDEEDILELVRYNLEREGYKVFCAGTGEDGLKMVENKEPDLIILDLMLPGMDGLEVCKNLKNDSRTAHLPVIMLTAKGEEADIITGLELGADDYVTKPFSTKVLLARLKMVLRRDSDKTNIGEQVLKRRNLTINTARREVLLAGNDVELTFSEFEILFLLAARPGRVFTRSQIVQKVKGDGYPVTERAIDVQIVGLRKKLGPAAEYIETVRGVGYRFKDVRVH